MFDVQDLQQTAAPSSMPAFEQAAANSSASQVHLLDRLTAVFRHLKGARRRLRDRRRL